MKCGRGFGEMGEKGKGTKKCKLVFKKLSWGCKVQHREYSQSIITVITMHIVRWVLDLLSWSRCKLLRCLITMLYTKTNIILNVSCNWTIIVFLMHNYFYQRSDWQGPSQYCLGTTFFAVLSQDPKAFKILVSLKFMYLLSNCLLPNLQAGNSFSILFHMVFLPQTVASHSPCNCLVLLMQLFVIPLKCKALEAGIYFPFYVPRSFQPVSQKYVRTFYIWEGTSTKEGIVFSRVGPL